MENIVYAIKTTRDIKWGDYPVVPAGSYLKSPVWLTPATSANEVWRKPNQTPVKRLVSELNNRLVDIGQTPGVEMVELVEKLD